MRRFGGVGGFFLPFFLPVKVSIQSGNRRWEFRYCLLYKAANEGKGKRRQGRRWFRVRRCVSLLNRNRRLSSELLAALLLSFRWFKSEFFFFLIEVLTSKSFVHSPGNNCVREREPQRGNQWQIGCNQLPLWMIDPLSHTRDSSFFY